MCSFMKNDRNCQFLEQFIHPETALPTAQHFLDIIIINKVSALQNTFSLRIETQSLKCHLRILPTIEK